MLEVERHLDGVECFYVINLKREVPEEVLRRAVFITHAERNWKLILNFFEGLALCRKRHPDVIISTGAGQIIPIALAAKVCGIPVVFIESMSRVRRPSWSGRIMYYLADRFFYQWSSLEWHYPRGIYTGPLL